MTETNTTRAAGSSAQACWPDERAEELKVLQQLLATISGLNHGSGFVESLQWCIAAAKCLQHSDIAGLRSSFIDHLLRDCVAERTAKQPA
jgi:hypothetical protein